MERPLLRAYVPLSRGLNFTAPLPAANWRRKTSAVIFHSPASRQPRIRPASSKPPIRRSGNPKPSSHSPSRTRKSGVFVQDVSAATLSNHASQALKAAEAQASIILQQQSIPTEAETKEALKAIEIATIESVNSLRPHTGKPEEGDNPTSALLALDSETPERTTSKRPLATKAIDSLSELAHELLLHPPVFITPDILQTYVRIQSHLGKPATLPEVFSLYANKPVPDPQTSPIRYTTPNPSRPSQAIPVATANLALDAAINAPSRDLAVALGIIETAYHTPAFRRSKIIRRAVPPIAIVSAAPLAAWTLATQVSTIQTSMDPQLMTQGAFAGILTYIAAVGTIGFVAMTTANDQMERVSWAVGMPLRERWVREEERAAVDRVAQAWGFKEVSRRGEEEGVEWESLKEWVGVRGMVLDKVGLMEGMQ